jgi:hypothetical protein
MSNEASTMKIPVRMLVAGSMLALPLAALFAPSPVSLGLVGEAHAVVGRPATPVSAAGVARRTAVRTTAAVTSTSAAQAAAQPAPPPPAPTGAAPAEGTVVTSLPAGCVSAPVGGVEYYLCNGVYYRPAFEGNNLVYVVQKP